MFPRSFRSIVLVAAFIPLGCSSLNVASMFDRQKVIESGPKNPVADIICLWEPAEGRGLESMPARGFAGQLLFLTRGSTEPAKVKGDVRVYVFDDQGSLDNQSKPLHQFDFDAESFSRYFYKTSFGAAYQLFIPYTRTGSHEARCGLRVRFTPADGGPPVYSKMADVTLPGAKPKTSAQRWNPEHRQLRADALEQTGVPPAEEPALQDVAESLPTKRKLAHPTASIPLPATARAVQARSRLQKLAAQLAEAENAKHGDGVQPAVHETEAPAYETETPAKSAPLRFRLHRDEP